MIFTPYTEKIRYLPPFSLIPERAWTSELVCALLRRQIAGFELAGGVAAGIHAVRRAA
jgi:hypothetical protein